MTPANNVSNVAGTGQNGPEDKVKVSNKAAKEYRKKNLKKFTEFLKQK